MSEVWKVIAENSNYEVSSKGDTRNIKRNILLKPKIDHKGYLRVDLWKNNKGTSRKIHRLVAIAFLDNPLNKPAINHIDGDKTNNNICNLEWVTNKENAKHAIQQGLILKGEDHPGSKLTKEDVICIMELKGKLSNSKISQKYNISNSLVSMLHRGKRWTYLTKGLK